MKWDTINPRRRFWQSFFFILEYLNEMKFNTINPRRRFWQSKIMWSSEV